MICHSYVIATEAFCIQMHFKYAQMLKFWDVMTSLNTLNWVPAGVPRKYQNTGMQNVQLKFSQAFLLNLHRAQGRLKRHCLAQQTCYHTPASTEWATQLLPSVLQIRGCVLKPQPQQADPLLWEVCPLLSNPLWNEYTSQHSVKIIPNVK